MKTFLMRFSGYAIVKAETEEQAFERFQVIDYPGVWVYQTGNMILGESENQNVIEAREELRTAQERFRAQLAKGLVRDRS